ncbi:hypothetical protein [Demequina aurantiaca]|uniref:hypothetical protein n=1 Tax=Demequina aurantiaca TaxID=676200 RepID=UPI003D330300
MTRPTWAPFTFTHFEQDIARRPRIQAELEAAAARCADWDDVRAFCTANAIRMRELS